MNFIELRKENEARGWLEVPESCPTRFVSQICEKRAFSIQTGKPIPNVVIRSARPVVKSLEQYFFEKCGREVRHWRRPVKMETLEEKIKRQALEIRCEQFRDAEEAHRKRFGEGIMSADEVEYMKRQFAERTGLDF